MGIFCSRSGYLPSKIYRWVFCLIAEEKNGIFSSTLACLPLARPWQPTRLLATYSKRISVGPDGLATSRCATLSGRRKLVGRGGIRR